MGRHAFGLDVDGLLAARDAASRAYASEQEEIAAEWHGLGSTGKAPARQDPATMIRLAKAFGSGSDGAHIPALLPIIVDVYLSAGPHSADPYSSCNNTDQGECSLWRVRMYLGATIPIEVQRVATGGAFTTSCPVDQRLSHVQPAVSPNGDQLAWVRNCLDSSGSAQTGSLVAKEIGDTSVVEAYAGVRATDQSIPQYPTWSSDSTLYFNTSAGNVSTAWKVDGYPTFSSPNVMFGPLNESYKTTTGYEDLDAHPGPAYSGSSGIPQLVSFGGDTTGAEPAKIPRVTDLVAATEEEFELPEGWSGTAPECHHPAWNPDGTEILCTRYQEPETLLEGEVSYDVRRLYAFGHGGGAWRAPRKLVSALNPDVFNAISRQDGAPMNLFRPRDTAGDDGCGAYVWKFAQWCVDDRFVVATVYCTDNMSTANPKDVLNSRVYLINVEYGATSASDYIDLVRFVELYVGGPAAVGTYNGIYSTCRKVPPDEVV